MNETNNRAPVPVADMESHYSYAPHETVRDGQFHKAVSIHIHSVRKRPVDPDGTSAKAVIDALVADKVLRDDTPEHVKEVTYSQEKGSPEKTIITISDEF